jgi:MinD-like ATPase involved in chromosome partitioning or flagellar assembly
VYTTTFYSFKGGVGRTLALVNVGVELANSGKRVLLVDFDLEAPGIDTFKELQSPSGQAGIVDYVTDYLRSGSPPDFTHYHYHAKLSMDHGGGVWVMPAGRRDASYAAKLAVIDWQDLYANKNGFLLLENLKNQWSKNLQPDYVLIDSRTGHTEVGGICTRQLPDGVVILFIPNQQNLSGLTGVVDSIRQENEKTGRQPIDIEFVASNVPSLDDEEQILQSLLKQFSQELDYSTETLVIDRYDSLHLLNQSIFVLDRPRSRLSRTYRALMKRITSRNLDDREAALAAMSADRTRWLESPIDADSHARAEMRINEIINRHLDDAEILCEATRFCSDQEEWSAARSYSERTVEVARRKRDTLSLRYALRSIGYRIQGEKRVEDVSDLLELLDLENLEFDDINRGLKLVKKLVNDPPASIVALKSLRRLTDHELANLASEMQTSREWEKIAWSFLNRGNSITELVEPTDTTWLGQASLIAISLGKFDVARRLLSKLLSFEETGVASVSYQFNFAMASWGEDPKNLPVDLFKFVVSSDFQSKRQLSNANYSQCIAMAKFITGEKEDALLSLNQARQTASSVPFPFIHFSCWSYLELPLNKFLQDLDKMERFFAGESILPEFMSQAASIQSKGNSGDTGLV